MSCANGLETRTMSINSSESIFKCLMDNGEFDLCLAWLKMHPLAECPTKYGSFLDVFREIVLATTSLNCIMFKIIPWNIALQFYDNLLAELRSLELLEYITEFLVANSLQPSIYQRYRISLKIFSQMNEEDQDTNWILFNTPLMIIVQYRTHEAMSSVLKSIKSILSSEPCKHCFARRNSSYDAKSSSDPNFKISTSENAFGYKDHSLSIHCIDSLLKIYASKALDFRVSETHSHSSNELLSHSTASLDSLCGSFVMPKVARDRCNWIKDEEATHCMCCRRSAFTMLCRRHHCRRCGRVVCHVCSTKRIEIPELYCDVKVRSCDDCYKQIQSNNQRKSSHVSSFGAANGKISDQVAVWQFSGNKKHDNLLREEFCFEYAPSVSLCLSILQFYSSDEDCVKFLLYHCQKFESLLRPIQPNYPNPEIDYALVTRMMHCLALAAKVRGGPPECDTIRDHGEIIQSIVHHGCESLMPPEPPNSSSFRTLRDSLVLAEKWSLALELSLKCGFQTTGVLAAWGIACLRAGCFDTACEKFSHCLTKTGTDDETFHLTSLILQESLDELTEWNETPKIKRPVKSPPLLEEIMCILELSCPSTHQPEVIARASIIKDSNTSLASNMSKKREKISLHEPALNVMHTLSSLKNITRGIYDGSRNVKNSSPNKKFGLESTNCRKAIRCSRFYYECLYYLTRYGSHNSILAFLIKNDQLSTALKYFLYQNVEADSFINVIFLPFLKSGKVDIIINLALLTKISAEVNKLPTLFGTLHEKIELAVLTIIVGSNINAGFGLAFRIIQDFNLSPIKVYGITAKYLSGHNRLDDVEKLIENIKSNSDSDSALCDEIISLSIHTAVASSPLNAPVKQLK